MSEVNMNSISGKLIQASKSGDVLGVAAALSAGADKEARDRTYCNYTPLHWGAENGHKNVTIKLFNANVNIEARDGNGMTALHQCCFAGHESILLLLIGRGAQIDATDNKGFTPLMAACQEGHANLVELLLNAGANVRLQAKGLIRNGNAPIHYACKKCNGDQISVVNLLVQHGADISVKDDVGIQPIHEAAHNGFDKIVKTLIKLGADVNCTTNNGTTSLWLASRQGHDKVVERLLKYKVFVNHISCGATPLYKASQNGNSTSAHMLLKHGAKVNFTNSEGNTPLMTASGRGSDELILLLIAYGAKINAVNNKGESALLAACQNGHLTSVNILIEKGADLNEKSRSDISPLYIACYNGFDDILETLLQNGAKKNIRTKNLQVTHIAAQRGRVNALMKLKENKCDLNAVALQTLDTPLHLAVRGNHEKVANWLIINGANPYAFNKERNTAIQLALNMGNTKLATFMTSKNSYSIPGNSTASTSTEATNLECAVCLDHRTTTVMTLPCRHAKICQKCMDDMKEQGDNQCPICRVVITQRIPIYL